MKTGMAFNVRIDHDPATIRHIAIQCPKCKEWFHGRDLTDELLTYDTDLYHVTFICPLCYTLFGKDTDYEVCCGEEADYPEIYVGCYQKSTVFTKTTSTADVSNSKSSKRKRMPRDYINAAEL